MRLFEYKTTGNSSVWKKLRKHYLDHRCLIRCDRCRYHKMENCGRKPRRSWKSRRKTQFRYL